MKKVNLDAKLDTLARLLPALVCMCFSMIWFFEVYDISVNPADYINKYGIAADENEWQYRSVTNFRLKSMGCAFACLGMAGWCFYIYNRKSKLQST